MTFEIISANYNNAKFLVAFFDSILNSFRKPSSIIIVDDCSKDNSVDIIKSYADKLNINLILNEKNIGFASSLNIALKELQAPYFARLDPDDAVHRDRFLKQLVFLDQNPEIAVVGTNVNYVLNGEFKWNSDVILDEKEITAKLHKGILPVIHGSILGRTEAIKDFRYKQELVPAEDYDLFAFMVSKGFRIKNLMESLTLVTVHSNSVSNDLKFTTIGKRFRLAEEYFNFRKSYLGMYFEYIHLLNYRRYLFEGTLKRYFYLLVSAAAMPIKSSKKLFKYLLNKF